MSEDTADPGVEAPGTADARYERLSRATGELRDRLRSVPIDRWLQITGAVLLPAAAVLILLGWYGASHTTRVWEQVPYLISGGVLGLAFAFVGGFAYFAYWLTRLVAEERQRAEQAEETSRQMLESLRRIEASVAGGAASNGSASLVATATGSMVHRPDCPAVAGNEVRSVGGREAARMRSCKICQPEAAGDGGGRSGTRGRRSRQASRSPRRTAGA